MGNTSQSPPRVKTPRTFQTAAIDAVRREMRAHRRVVLVSPTGSGKTFMGTMAVWSCVARGRRALWLPIARS